MDAPAPRPTRTEARLAPPRLDQFPHRVTEIIRFADLDPQGHVNNAVYSTYFESGRVAMFRSPELGIGQAGATFVLARIEIDFRRELTWPGTVEVGTGVLGFGRSSFTVMQGVFHNGVCAASARAVLACIDLGTRRARPLAEAQLARLRAWMFRPD